MVRLSWLLIAALLFAVPAYTADLTGESVIIDGDTIKIAGERIRLHGIDAPESKQLCKVRGKDWRCGWAAADRSPCQLASWPAGKPRVIDEI